MERTGHVYSRISNPTVAVLEERIATLEDGIVATRYAMTRYKAGRAIAQRIAGYRIETIAGRGHAITSEAPDALLRILASFA